MSSITQNFSASIGGILFTNTDTITANSTSVINGRLDLTSAEARDFPIFAEGDSSGDIRMIAVEFSSSTTQCQFLDSSNSVVFDARAALGEDFTRYQSYLFPGNGALTLASTNDIVKVRIKTTSGFGNLLTRVAIAHEVTNGDTIS